MVSLTLMLVIATIVSSIQMTLPVTPYLKMIDVWLFAATNMMGYLLIFHTYIEFKLKYSSNKHSGLLFTRRNSKWGNVTESSTRYKKILCKVVLSKEVQIVYIIPFIKNVTIQGSIVERGGTGDFVATCPIASKFWVGCLILAHVFM